MKDVIKYNRLILKDSLSAEELDILKGGQSAPEVMCCCTSRRAFKKDAKSTLEQQELR